MSGKKGIPVRSAWKSKTCRVGSCRNQSVASTRLHAPWWWTWKVVIRKAVSASSAVRPRFDAGMGRIMTSHM